VVDPDQELKHDERAHLVQVMSTPGWPILQKLMEQEVERSRIALISVKPGDTAALIETHAIAKAAHQFCLNLFERLNYEHMLYVNSGSTKGTIQNPIDMEQEMMLDIGEREEE
jgi:hypothetical protein